MAITFAQYLQSLLQSITTYYTATYSNDTVLYDILRMYSSEFTSGSIALETVRNNLFIVTCENSKLFDNFGTYFGQNKYTDQTYVEDRYVSGSGTFKVVTPTLKVTQVSGLVTTHYAVPGAGVSGSTVQYASIPGYKKQLDFMLEAAVQGGTHQGIIRASNAFTLINPDIREAYATPQWKLKSTLGQITQVSANVWQFSNSESWRDNLWQGSHATFTSGSITSDKIAVGYVILVNDNNTVDVGPIYDSRLLLDLVRPN